MILFKYSGYSSERMPVSGQIEANSQDEALAQLQKQGFFVTKISSAGRSGKKQRGKVSSQELVVFTRLLSTMANANVPLVDGLETACGQVEGGLRQVLQRLLQDIKTGRSLSEALSAHPSVFSRLYFSMVRAGEVSGKLSVILEQLYSFMERMSTLRRKVVSALIYPSIIMILSFVIASIFMLLFIPQFKTNFGDMGDRLPDITRFVIALSDWFESAAPYLFISLAVVVLGLFRFFRTRGGRRVLDRLRIRMPLVGGLVRKVILVRVTRTLGTLLDNGVPIIETLTIVASAAGNSVMEDLLNQMKRKIADGQRMAETLRGAPLIPRMVLQMVAIGEETGHLPEMLLKSAEYYDTDVDVAVERLTSVITPILIISLGLFIGLLIVALFLPMFNMSSMTG